MTGNIGAYVTEPIAVVGMACRFPGSDGLEAFWKLLEEGRSAVTEGDPGSGEGRIGQIFADFQPQNSASRFGAFIEDIDRFDPTFFRISPLEAQFLDPQQRLMLEVSWKALEDAGIDPEGLRGSRTGVFGGITHSDYREIIGGIGNRGGAASSLYAATGTSQNTAIGRVAYVLGLQGPAISIDTACSSSLVAVHQAATALRQEEADIALAGGVTAMLSGNVMEARAGAGMLSPDGSCKTFDEAANGYVRGEGCGILVLKRLRDAVADGDRIWGIIRGSAINQDGASAGLTVPNGEAQEDVIREALRRAGLSVSQIDYVETHGTGTPVGDPLELQAVASVFGTERKADNPLYIGSVKTNFGHLESAAGAASLIKVFLAMHQGVIPKHLNFNNPSPAIDWENLPIRVPVSSTAWPAAGGRPRVAGISGYGWSGTNAHLIVESYGAPLEVSTEPQRLRLPTGSPRPVAAAVQVETDAPALAGETRARPARLLPLSGKTEQALRDLAVHYRAWLEERGAELEAAGAAGESPLSDMAWTAGSGRSHFGHRAAVVFRDAESLREGLEAVAQGGRGAEPRRVSRVAFVYTGQGSQWDGMGRTLYETEPVFRAVLDRCERVVIEERGRSLLDVMFGSENAAGDLSDTYWTQPAIYSLECALTALWGSEGVRPDVVIGHSLGELAAAQAAGVFGLEDGLRFVMKRGEALGSVPELGAMAAVFATQKRVQEAIDEFNTTSDCAELNISVDNGVHQVISGPTAAVQAIGERFESEEVRVRPLNTSQAFHSVLVEPALEPLGKAYDSVAVGLPEVALVSNVTGTVLEQGETLDAEYWRNHARNTVQFRRGIGALAELGVDLAIEVGPGAILGPLVSLVWPGPVDLPEPPKTPDVLQSMTRPRSGENPAVSEDAFLRSVAGAYEAGLTICFDGLFATEERRKIELPGYPFQRERYWVEEKQRRRTVDGHPLLGVRHESPRGEVTFESEMSPSDPAWLTDHRVYERVVMPGAIYGAVAAAVALREGSASVEVEDLQLQTAMVFAQDGADGDESRAGRRVQAVLNSAETGKSRKLEVFSRGAGDDGWTLHSEAMLSFGTRARGAAGQVDRDSLKAALTPQDVPGFYRARAESNINLGRSFRTLQALWAGGGEAVGEIALPDGIETGGIDVHPLLLDGCFQVMSAARHSTGSEDGEAYLPFAWERMWLAAALPDRLVCRARFRDEARDSGGSPSETREVLVGDLTIYGADGAEVGGITGYAVKRATRAALLSSSEGIQDLLYEIVWRDSLLEEGMQSADFLTGPASIAADAALFARYLSDEGVEPDERAGLLNDLERLSWRYALAALERLGWTRSAGEVVEPEALRNKLNVLDEHRRLFRRLFELLARAGVVEESGEGFIVRVGADGALPDVLPPDAVEFAEWMSTRYSMHGSNEVGLFRRSANALADALTGRADPLTLLFSSGEPTAADLYMKAPVARAANRMLGDAIRALLAGLPAGRKLRILEIGAGTGSATASVLPELPAGRFEYVYTDISAGFFSEAEARFGGSENEIEYRVLDVEKSPAEQGYAAHSFDLLIASNVLHATRYLSETLGHCLELLAPSGQLVMLENLRGQGWLDLTFGQLDGWWRFADDYRPHHALASPAVWRQALTDAGFGEIGVLGTDETDPTSQPDRGVILASGPAKIEEPAGVWVMVGDTTGVAEELARELAGRNQTVILASPAGSAAGRSDGETEKIVRETVEFDERDSWRSVLQDLPQGAPLKGIVHLVGLNGHGETATTTELGEDAREIGGSALALMQGVSDADVTPETGVWFVTRGGQVLERERKGQIAGAMIWGFGRVVSREAPHLQPRMIDLDPDRDVPPSVLANELMYPDTENHVAYRLGGRRVARLVRSDTETGRLALPDDTPWLLGQDEGGSLDGLHVLDLPERTVGPREVRIAPEAAGLNFSDVLLALGLMPEGLLGDELCGRVLEVGSDVAGVAVGDRVVALGFGTFASEMVVTEEMVVPAPKGIPATALASMPTVFVTATLSYEMANLKAGDRVLIHAGSGGVGLAAIQMARAAGAEVLATASAPKQAFLRSIGIEHVFDSRQTSFAQDVLEATGGEGVDVVLNSLTSEGFIEASLSCLARGGRFIELGRRDIFSREEMAAARPDVDYHVLQVDVLKKNDPGRPGRALASVMKRVEAGELEPILHSRWSMSDASAAFRYMQSARHIGKIVMAKSPLQTGRLRENGTYLITGGLGGIGCELAGRLADLGAGAETPIRRPSKP
ncbi:MAG: beta-ketoacyl synthase N-terminal-like domain-containing protein [Chloroflexota bacterium]|nr:beta-ketoacyl synthase N-terminal-like domain-containing protein [Chloroflexota bacterium]